MAAPGDASMTLTSPVRQIALVGAAVALLSLLLPASVFASSGNAGIQLHKTVAATAVTPSLSLNLGVDRPSAIPGDRLTYSGSLSNTGASLGLSGGLTAESHG